MDKFMPKTIEQLNAEFEARMEKAKQDELNAAAEKAAAEIKAAEEARKAEESRAAAEAKAKRQSGNWPPSCPRSWASRSSAGCATTPARTI